MMAAVLIFLLNEEDFLPLSFLGKEFTNSEESKRANRITKQKCFIVGFDE
jgi:hypothetical protein